MQKPLLILTLTASLTASQAAVVLSDSFTYPDGPLVGAPGSPWSNHSGTAGSMLVTNNQLIVTTARSEDANAPLAGAPYLASDSSIALFSSFKFVVSNTLPNLAGTYFAHFKGTNSGAFSDFGARVWLSASNIVTSNAVPAGKFRLSIANGAAASDNNLHGQIDQDLDTNVVYSVVTRFVPSTGIATIWLNPTSISDSSATAIDSSITVPNSFNVFTYAFRQASGEGQIWVDDLKVGTQFADVAGANTSPVISSIPGQNIAANANTGPVGFTVSDAESPATSLTVSASSSNTGLIPNNPANLTLAGTGTNRTITVTPAAGQQGYATITVTVSDGANSSFTTFLVAVGAPTISTIPDQLTLTNTPLGPISFTIGDNETPNSLTVTASSSNPTVVQDTDITISPTGTSRTLTISPQPDQAGLTRITLVVSDGTLTNSTSFFLTVYPHLGLVLGDDFNGYPDGDIQGASSGFWVAHSAANSNDCFVASGQLTLSMTNSEDVHAIFTNSAFFASDSGVVLYSKFIVVFTTLPKFNGGSYFAHYKDLGTSNFRGRIYAETNGAAAGTFRLGIANGAASVNIAYPRDLSLGQPYTVVTRYDVSTATTTLWINPRYETSTSVSATDVTAPIEIDDYCFRQDGTSGGIGIMRLDDLLVGTGFTDVVPFVASPAAIPLDIAVNSGNAVLTWSNPQFNLQSAPEVTGPWTTIWEAGPGYSTPISASQQYFRLVFQ